MDNSTITAIATPLAAGGVGVIRLSGPLSRDILLKVFRPYLRALEKDAETISEDRSSPSIQSHRFYHGYIVDNGQLIDEVMVVFMLAPRSYTGEDVVEIHAHSGPFVLRTILQLLIQNGARMAGPGEFTRRAFINGKMDLTQAEAIADIIDARSREALNIAVNQAAGKLSLEVAAIKDLFVDILVEIEAAIDFSDQADEPVSRATLLDSLNAGAGRLHKLIDRYNAFSWQRKGITVALVGAPNVGKSTLLNTLLCRDRAIVSPTPGTTRDFLEETLSLEGLSFVFIDTAGLRSEAGDDLEEIGMERTRHIISGAEAVVFMVDAAEGVSADDREIMTLFSDKYLIIVANKVDLPQADGFAFPSDWTDRYAVVKLSALKGDGLETLKSLLVGRYNDPLSFNADEEGGLLPNLRHMHALEKALLAVKSAQSAIEGNLAEDFIAMDLREMIGALNDITGHATGTDVLDNIFSRFCIGK